MRRLAVFLVVIWLAAPASATEPLASGDGRLRLVPSAGSEPAALLTPGGREDLDLPLGFNTTALTLLEDGWLVAGQAAEGDGHRLHLVAQRGAERRELPPPPGQIGRHRISPAPLVARGRLLGLAWLEGDGPRSLAVRTATWEEGAWRPGPWVSAPGPGSQLALSATILEDGRWLLVWTRWDGEDDEVVWSVGDGERFSPPTSLHHDNRVPDITPAIIAVRGGALAAWSRYDGNDYRLRLARFDGAGWSELDWTGGRGSLEPGFRSSSRRRFLLFRTVATDSWELLELSAAGRVRRRAAAAASPIARPFVDLDGPRPILTWPLTGERVVVEWQRP